LAVAVNVAATVMLAVIAASAPYMVGFRILVGVAAIGAAIAVVTSSVRLWGTVSGRDIANLS
jgi:hypothetical protein